MDAEFLLNCWTKGEAMSNVFPVKILRTDTVGSLQKVIKEEKKSAFDHVAADALVLWNVNVLATCQLATNIAKLNLGDVKPLPANTLLSEVFDNPPKNFVHIVVHAPSPISCE